MLSQESQYRLSYVGVPKRLIDVKSETLKTGGSLAAVLPSRLSWFARDVLKQLDNHVCRMAFVGQVKAGKSTLINALIGKPGLLPTDINPSTAVITKIFFGERSQPQNTALFHFFTENEWEGLMSGKAAAQGAPGLHSLPTTKLKLAELQRRAEKRLGPNYSNVLGKHHLFSSVTPKILSNYVSTGDYGTASEKDVLYSDITKMAEIFLEGMPFSYPSVMIDTPGVNDLFFIRDEVTQSNLADADIYIVVLSAQNPLSEGDLSLLRLLRGLQRDKIIAVINRIDRLENPIRDAPKVEAFVREALRREFPNASIPVLLASAFWANAALGKLKDGATMLKERGDPELGTLARPVIDEDAALSSGIRAKSAELLTYSGIPRIVEFISQFMTNGIAEEQLLPTAATLSAIAHNTAMSSRLALRALAPDKILANPKLDIADALRRQAGSSLDQLTALTNEAENFLADTSNDWEAAAAGEVANLERYIYHSIEGFAETQSIAFARGPRASFPDIFFREALRFRTELSDDFAAYHTQISKGLLNKQSEAESFLRKIVKAKLPGLDNVVQFGFMPRRIKPPSIMSLAKATTLETDEFWQILLEAPPKNEAETIAELKVTITSEFIVILKDMLDSARSDLKLTGDEVINRLRLMAFSAIFPLVGHLTYLAGALGAKAVRPNEGLSDSDGIFMRGFQERMKKSLSEQEALVSRLNEIKKECLAVPIG